MLGVVVVALIFVAAAVGQEFYQGPPPKELPPSKVEPPVKT